MAFSKEKDDRHRIGYISRFAKTLRSIPYTISFYNGRSLFTNHE